MGRTLKIELAREPGPTIFLRSPLGRTRETSEIVGRELDVARREAELRSAERMAMRWHHPAMLMGYILVAYVGKIVVFDTMLGLGETPAIRGAVGDWLGMVATFFVGVSGVASAATSVAAILKRR